MKCTSCGEADHSSDAVYCHVCGNRLKKSNTIAIVFLVLGVLLFVLVIKWMYPQSNEGSGLGYAVPVEPYQPTKTKITINGEDVSDIYSIGGSSVVIIDNNECLTNNPVNCVFTTSNRYTKLCVENAFEVNVSDTAHRITISTNERVMPEVIVTEGSDKLTICNKFSISSGLLKVTIPYNPNLQSVSLSGVSKFNSNYAMKGQDIKIVLSGSSSINCKIEAVRFDIKMAGSSEATLSGQVGLLKLDLSGTSCLNTQFIGDRYAFACDNGIGSMSGSCVAYIHCDKSINVKLSGACNLYYSGNANSSGSTTSNASHFIHY